MRCENEECGREPVTAIVVAGRVLCVPCGISSVGAEAAARDGVPIDVTIAPGTVFEESTRLTVSSDGVATTEAVPGEKRTWAELFPEGRTICYEGDDPDGFAAEIEAEFGFNPANDPAWNTTWLNGDPEWPDPFGRSHWFRCPPEHLDAIYAGGEWPVGS